MQRNIIAVKVLPSLYERGGILRAQLGSKGLKLPWYGRICRGGRGVQIGTSLSAKRPYPSWGSRACLQ